jgi:hypothetical protein
LDDHGHRLANFAPYKTDEQFSNQMHLLAEQAAEAVLALRAKFSTLDAIATALRFAAKHRSLAGCFMLLLLRTCRRYGPGTPSP